MKTLKEIREQLGISQAEVAKKINTNQATYCYYELNQTQPPMESLVILEREFEQRIKWNEEISINEKRQILSDIIILSKLYPLSAVLNFAQRSLREGIRLGHPGILINHYAEVATGLDIEPLLPTDLNKSDKI